MDGEVYLIKKHGLYYKPNHHGYTGIRDEAGRYTKEEAERIGHDYVHEDDAPAYSPDCYSDFMEAHIRAKDKRLKDLEHENARLRGALDGLLSCYINPQAHKTPTASDISKYRNSVIKAKQALAAPIEKNTTEEK